MRKKINFYIDQDHLDRLYRLNKETGTPIAEFIRRMIDDRLKDYEDKFLERRDTGPDEKG